MTASDDGQGLSGRRSIVRRTAFGLLPAALGAGLFALAFVRLIAELAMAPANQYLSALQTGDNSPLSRGELITLARSRRTAINWFPSGQSYLELALAEIQLSALDEAHGTEILSRARRHLYQGLSRKPLDPYAWTQVATVAAMSQDPSDTIERALEMSVMVAPYDPKLVQTRVAVALAVWPLLDDKLHNRIYEQIRFAWNTPVTEGSAPAEQKQRLTERARRRRELVQMATTTGQIGILRQALADKNSLEQIMNSEVQQRKTDP